MAYHQPNPPPELAPHIRLWILRLLTAPNHVDKFVRKDDFARDNIAYAVGMGHWINAENRPFNAQTVRAELYQKLAMAQQACAQPPIPDLLGINVQRLSKLVGLDETDSQILAFAVCLHTEPLLDEATDLLGSLSTAQVVQTLALLLDLPEAQVRRSVGGQGLLARTGLVVIIDGGHLYSLQCKLDLLSQSFADQMASSDADPVHLLRGKILSAAPGRLALTEYGHIQSSLDIVRPWLRHAQNTGRRGVNIYVHGAPGTGKTELARALAQDIGCDLFEVASEDENGDPVTGFQRLRAFSAAQAFLAKRKALLLFDEVEDVFSSSPTKESAAQSHKAWLNRMLEDNPVPALWLSNALHDVDTAFLRRFDMVFELPVPPRSQRARIVQTHCGTLLDAPRLKRVTEAEHLAPAVVARASTVAHAIEAEMGREASANAFERLVSHTLQAQGYRPLLRHDPSRLPEAYDTAFLNADTDLNQIAQGMANAANAGGARLCLYGPPGTGKTAFGRWLAEQLDKPLLVRRASDLLSKYIGEAEKNIARAFREAEEDGALLLIDEVDSFLQDRRGAQRSWEVTQVNEMLTQMESFTGVLIASTNLMDGLDPAALRRFDLKVKLGYLQADQAWALLQRHCAQLQISAPGDPLRRRMSRLHQLTPGDFAAVLRQQRFRPLPDADTLVAALEAECAFKQSARSHIGFV